MGSYLIHPSSYIEDGCSVGANTKIWHFSHVMKGCIIGPGEWCKDPE